MQALDKNIKRALDVHLLSYAICALIIFRLQPFGLFK